jgi:hypothetical protein
VELSTAHEALAALLETLHASLGDGEKYRLEFERKGHALDLTVIPCWRAKTRTSRKKPRTCARRWRCRWRSGAWRGRGGHCVCLAPGRLRHSTTGGGVGLR